MTNKERFIKALKREYCPGHVPTFELEFFLTMESFGKVHPLHRCFYQWDQMSRQEKKLQIEDIADCYLKFAAKYHHSAILVHPSFNDYERMIWLLETIREKSGDEYFLLLLDDPTFAIPDGSNMEEFSIMLYEEPNKCKEIAEERLENSLRTAEFYAKHQGLVDGYALCSDYCFNTNPFFSPSLFDEFIGPYLARVIQGFREMGFYTIKHTDGNVMPILSRIVDCKPDAIHSLDPQGGVNLSEVMELYGDRMTFIGNVNCALLQTGTLEECDADVRRALRQGMARGKGYIFSTSNCVYTGLPLERYERMNRIWWEEGIYSET
jgi:uroporphyrinogen decarboxylase